MIICVLLEISKLIGICCPLIVENIADQYNISTGHVHKLIPTLIKQQRKIRFTLQNTSIVY